MNKVFDKGSLGELWKMSYPMMINFFSLCAMLFVDRIYLSWYSEEALSASVTSGTLAWAFITSILTLSAMSEVFVSQFNGAKKFENLGKPVWQMLWLCLFSFAFFIPAGLFLGPILFPLATSPLEHINFSFFMFTGPFFCFHAAIAGFFIGRGYPKVIQWMAIASNLINISLDPIFIWGIDGVIPAFGMIGAAYATLVGAIIQSGVVFLFFISKKNNDQFNTRNFRFDKKLFLSCLKVGVPPAIFILLELIGWTIFYMMMKGISENHIFVAGVCQSILLLFFFVGWGIEKGCVALAGNFIGQKKTHLVKNVLYSAIKLLLIFGAILAVIALTFSSSLVNWFFNDAERAAQIESVEETKQIIQSCLYLIFFYIIIENIRWAINGLLTAAGDTLFLLIAGTASLWVFCFIPIYFFIYLTKAPIFYAYLIQVVYAILSASIVYLRFAQGKWKTRSITSEETTSQSINSEPETPQS